jgi:hypothetical protein
MLQGFLLLARVEGRYGGVSGIDGGTRGARVRRLAASSRPRRALEH